MPSPTLRASSSSLAPRSASLPPLQPVPRPSAPHPTGPNHPPSGVPRPHPAFPTAIRTGAALSSPPSPRPTPWSLPETAGRLVELSGLGASAALTFAFLLIREAQERGETTAWITDPSSTFFPPDVAENGVDLDALVVVRVRGWRALMRAADHLVRSGAFGLVVLDLGSETSAPTAGQSRLAGLARKHHTAILLLTEKAPRTPSIGSLVSLRAQVRRRRIGTDRFQCELRAIKDKRRAPGWTHREICRGPAGLC